MQSEVTGVTAGAIVEDLRHVPQSHFLGYWGTSCGTELSESQLTSQA